MGLNIALFHSFTSERNSMGACADAGQWARSGLDPVESLRKVKARLVSFHLKDIVRKSDPDSRNTVFGEGEGDVASVLKELKP